MWLNGKEVNSMAYNVDLTVALTGASKDQLYQFNRSGLLKPELSQDRHEGFLWSFRDLVALRSFINLRRNHSLQAIRKAMSNLRGLNLTDHPSTYQLVSDGTSVFLLEDEDDEDQATDLLRRNGQLVISSLEDIFKGFEHPGGKGMVVDFLAPRPNLEVNEGRLGGYPTIRGTRVAYDSVASLLADGSVSPEDVGDFYPGVSATAALDAANFDAQVADGRGWA